MKNSHLLSTIVAGVAMAFGVGWSSTARAHLDDDLPPGWTQRDVQPELLAAPPGNDVPNNSASISGQGHWRFRIAAEYRLPDSAYDKILGAHGGFAVDARTHDLYFGLKGVGMIRLGPKPGDSEILGGYPELTRGNLHNVTLFHSGGMTYLASPDNLRGKVYVLDLTDKKLKTINRPSVNDYYRGNGSFNPTDTEYHARVLYVTDGYSPGNFVLTADPFQARWLDLVFGGAGTAHGRFGTCHGITFDVRRNTLDISDRPHSRIERYDLEGHYLSSLALPKGSWPCDVDFYGRYAVVGCLFGPGKTIPAPVYILDQNGKILSTINPKKDLGIQRADHIHNATWWILPPLEAGGPDRVFLAVTAWSPGDFFILERIQD